MASRILEVECPDCGETQTVFENTSSEIECDDCGAALASPTGGKAEIHGEVVDVLEAREA